jgi:serine/threonine-protein kinase
VEFEPPADASGNTEGRRAPAERPELPRGASVDRYIIADVLARGGMGVVYKAFDPELSRPVAVKLVRADDDPAGVFRDRLMREAQALARLSHPNVISVFDVGTFGDEVFIAMEFVEGQSLRQWLESGPRSRREILDVFLAAGEGLAAAHEASLVHRDFKPENVIIGHDGRVRVLDFGLARLTGEGGVAIPPEAPPSPAAVVLPAAAPHETAAHSPSARSRTAKTPLPEATIPTPGETPSGSSGRELLSPLTRAGAIMGTPRFMAPEQHRGETADERADQFSFCVTLYHALFGLYPFSGTTVQQYAANVVGGRIREPPAAVKVPRWLRPVLWRGLAAAPADRYPSMTALLAELRKDPARTLKRGAVVMLAVAVIASAVGIGVFALRTRHLAAQRAQLASELGQEVAQMDSTARMASLMPLHDLRPEMEEILTRMRRIEKHVEVLGDVAVGPGLYAVGRGYLALEDWENAASELERAYATGYRSPQLAYSLGLAEGQLYQRALARLKKSGDPSIDAAQRADLARRFREPALRHLNEARDRLDGATATPEYVQGLIALYEQRFNEALALAAQAHARAPSLFEALTLEGDIYQAISNEQHLTGNDDGALDALARAGEAYRNAAEVARSDAQALGGLCRRWTRTAALEYLRPVSPEAAVEQALDACNHALRATPEDPGLLAELADAWSSRARWQADHNQDPQKAFAESVALAEHAVSLAPTQVYPRQLLAFIYRSIGEHRYLTGGDASESLDLAIRQAQRALELDPTSYAALSVLPQAYRYRALDEQQHGRDPSASFAANVDVAKRMWRNNPGSQMSLSALEGAYLAKAQWQLDHGIDPTESAKSGAAASREEIHALPHPFNGYVNLCYALGLLGTHQVRQHQDARDELEEAATACRTANGMNADDFIAHLNLGVVYSELAELALVRGGDPNLPLHQAREELARSLQLNSNGVTLWAIADNEVLAARGALAQRRDPSPALQASEEAAKHALAMDAKNGDALRELAVIARWRAEWLLMRHQPVGEVVRKGLLLVARSQAIQPGLGAGIAAEGALYLMAARAARQPGERVAAASKARSALERALQVNPLLAHEWQPLLDEASHLVESR